MVGVVQIKRADGSIIEPYQVKIYDFEYEQPMKFSIHKLPAANYDIIQKMGASNKIFTLRGMALTGNGKDFIISLPNNTGSIQYSGSSKFDTNPIPFTHVLFYNVKWHDTGRRPFEKHFILQAIEII